MFDAILYTYSVLSLGATLYGRLGPRGRAKDVCRELGFNVDAAIKRFREFRKEMETA